MKNFLKICFASLFVIGCKASKIDLKISGYFSIDNNRISVYKWDPGATGGVTVSLACTDSNESPKWSNRFLVINRDSDVKILMKSDTLNIFILTNDYALLSVKACGYQTRVEDVYSIFKWQKINGAEFHPLKG